MPSPVLLLVEDSVEDAALIVSALEDVIPAGQIKICGTGEEALDYLLQDDERPARSLSGRSSSLPQIVLLDLNLPRMSGLQVLQGIRADDRTRLLPVIVLSASVEQKDVRTATQAGANSFIRKSQDHARLADAIQVLAHYWLELNIAPPASALTA